MRAGAALVIGGAEHIDRGYDGMVAKLAACGAAIRRESNLSAPERPEGPRGKN